MSRPFWRWHGTAPNREIARRSTRPRSTPWRLHKEPADPLADARTRGRAVYAHYCRICHGEKGKADGFNAGKLDPPPRDFTNAKFWQNATDERLHDAVAHGGPYVGKSLGMPAWGHTLSEREIHDAIVFIRAFASQPESQAK